MATATPDTCAVTVRSGFIVFAIVVVAALASSSTVVPDNTSAFVRSASLVIICVGFLLGG